MEPERKSRKRRVDDVRTEGNPFRIDPTTNIVTVDPELIAQPQYQALLHALHEHYQRGTAVPLPFNFFPVREVPEELLLQLVNGDVRTFVSLSNSSLLMKARLKPLTARFVCEVWPDVTLLLAMACDLQLIQQLTRLNTAFPGSYDGNLMGFGTFSYGLQTRVQTVVRAMQLYLLSAFLRGTGGYDAKSKYYSVLIGKEIYQANPKYFIGRFSLPVAHKCHYSDVAAIKLLAEVMERGHQLGMQWRYNEMHRVLEPWGRNRKDKYNNFGLLPEELYTWTKASLKPGGKSPTPYEKIRIFTMEMCDVLAKNETQPIAPQPTMFEFQGVPLLAETEGFSVDAAHLLTMLKRYDAEVEFLLSRGFEADPLYVDLIPVDTLSNQVCLMVDAPDCATFWYDLMREMYNLVTEEAAERKKNGYSDKFHADAPYSCTHCHETAIRCDTKFQLPFCAQEDCLRVTFAKLHQYGLLQ